MSLRVVIDTNIRISSVISPQGTCARLIAGLRQDGHVQLISKPMLSELERKLVTKFRLPTTRAQAILTEVSESTLLIVSSLVIEACRDPDDNRVLECALAGEADYVVTGDHDLLALHFWEGLSILTARQFLDVYPPAKQEPRTIEGE